MNDLIPKGIGLLLGLPLGWFLVVYVVQPINRWMGRKVENWKL